MAAEEEDDLASFRQRARAWLAANMPRRDPGRAATQDRQRSHELQRMLQRGGLAGISVPREYGGQGLTGQHEQVVAQESAHFEMPVAFAISLRVLAPTLLAHASDLLKARHIPAMLRGDEDFIQLLSEPGGGSDLAGALTRATRDGDTWIINGSKMWSSGALTATHGLLLARTDFDVPKHAGLSMFVVPLTAPGIHIEPIREVDGDTHFCQEFFDDVVIPAENLVGRENDGWAVVQTLLSYERNATAVLGQDTATLMAGGKGTTRIDDLINAARARGVADDPGTRQLLGEAYVASAVAHHLNTRVIAGLSTGGLAGQWGSLLKLGMGVDSTRRAEIGLAVGGVNSVIWQDEPGGQLGVEWLRCRGIAIGGGTNEIQRNIVSERLLGLPREPTPDRGVPFREVLRWRTTTHAEDGT